MWAPATIATCLLLALLILPFLVLAADALGRTENLMIKVSSGVAVVSWGCAFLVGGFQQRPHAADMFTWAFLAWPFCLLVVKGFNSSLRWGYLWLSVPIMSWYLVNLSIMCYYPEKGGGGGMGIGLGFLLGWFYMVPLFAILGSFFLAGRSLLRRFRKG